ncbi:hypothetical protein CEXT_624831 [Caerostris extrusa]|uniref:Uncharacterized protein n=1 Tax=Caerostris extrusa TaxID=172846 RepID=A0AAV4Y0M9_CAEEX|nr:hypothetical protein CEXT_624831 [Caerostris extrusa]
MEEGERVEDTRRGGVGGKKKAPDRNLCLLVQISGDRVEIRATFYPLLLSLGSFDVTKDGRASSALLFDRGADIKRIVPSHLLKKTPHFICETIQSSLFNSNDHEKVIWTLKWRGLFAQ